MTTPHRYCLLCKNHDVDYKTNSGINYHAFVDDMFTKISSPPDPENQEEYQEWRSLGPRRFCMAAEPHPLYEANSIVIAFLGPSGSGKDHLVKGMRKQFRAAVLSKLSIHGRVNIQDFTLWEALEKGGITPPATPENPYQTMSLLINGVGAEEQRDVVIVNTSGEQSSGTEYPYEHMAFVPEADVITYTIPPEALDIESLRDPTQDQKTVLESITFGLQSIRNHVERHAHRNRKRIVVLTLTKADRYENLDDFPEALLRPRPAADLRRRIAAEQVLLARFLCDHGGTEIINSAAQINAPVFFSAVSGTGSDDLGKLTSESEVMRPATREFGASRCLDPLLFALMRENIGEYR